MRSPDDTDDLLGDPALCAFVDDLRAYASGPPPAVGQALAGVLTVGVGGGAARHAPAVARPDRVDGGRQWLRHRLQGRRGRLALGASVLSLTLLGTGAAGALPGPAQAIFERTAEVVGIELPEEARRDEAPAPSGPAPVVPGDQDGPDDGREAPRPRDEREPAPLPVDDGRGPAPSTPAGAGDRGPGAPDGAGAPGDDLSREARERAPESLPTPVSPPRPGPPDTLPGGPPDGVPGGGGSGGDGLEGDDDQEGDDQEDEADELGRDQGPVTPGPPAGAGRSLT